MIKKLFKSFHDTESKGHNVAMSTAILIITVLSVIALNVNRIDKLQADLSEIKKPELKIVYHLGLKEFETFKTEQEIYNESINGRIYANYTRIQQLKVSVEELKIDVDEISNEGINIRLDEILKDIERIERTLK